MPIINVKNLVKKFGDFVAVDNISFEVEKGSIFAFLGPNGAGKTTTIKMLTTLLEPTTGEILVNGHTPFGTNAEEDAVRKSIGIVFQDKSLDDELTAYENMDYHGRFYHMSNDSRKMRIEELLKYVELWERRDEFTKNYSGGMNRRLEIARGFMHHPKVLFLDEPTLGLDPQTRNHLWKYVEKMNKEEGITIFFTTHYMQEAEKYANKIAIIDHGKIMTIDTLENIKRSQSAENLEDAFLKLTGDKIREETASPIDNMRSARKMWTRK